MYKFVSAHSRIQTRPPQAPFSMSQFELTTTALRQLIALSHLIATPYCAVQFSLASLLVVKAAKVKTAPSFLGSLATASSILPSRLH